MAWEVPSSSNVLRICIVGLGQSRREFRPFRGPVETELRRMQIRSHDVQTTWSTEGKSRWRSDEGGGHMWRVHFSPFLHPERVRDSPELVWFNTSNHTTFTQLPLGQALCGIHVWILWALLSGGWELNVYVGGGGTKTHIHVVLVGGNSSLH